MSHKLTGALIGPVLNIGIKVNVKVLSTIT